MIDEKKEKKLNQLVDYVEKNNRFYAKFYKEVRMPIKDINELPVLQRKFIREHSDEIISDGYEKENLKYDCTNGTTEGRSLSVYKEPSEWVALDLDLWKSRRIINREAAEKYAFYYYNGKDYSIPYRLQKKGSRTTLQLPMRKRDEKEFLDDLTMIKEEKIQWIIGPPSIIFSLCCISLKYNFKVNVSVIESISEYLPSYYKIFFKQVLGGDVVIHYSCHEVWGMAFTDKLGKLKVMDECILNSVEDKRFHRGYGRCIATNLRLKSMPFINYELSDLVKIADDEIRTYGFRWTEEVKTREGNIHCSFFDNIFIEFKDMKLLPLENYQIIYSEDKIMLHVIAKDEEIFEKIESYVTLKIREEFQYNITVECIRSFRFYTDTISGKMRGIINYNDVNWEGWEFSLINEVSEEYIRKLL